MNIIVDTFENWWNQEVKNGYTVREVIMLEGNVKKACEAAYEAGRLRELREYAERSLKVKDQ